MTYLNEFSDYKQEFDNQFNQLVESGKNRDAIKLAKDFAKHCLISAAGVHLVRLDEPEKSVELLKTSLAIGQDAHTLNNLVCLHMSMPDYQKALEYATMAIKFSDADSWFNYGIVLQKLSRLKEAEIALLKAKELNPDCKLTRSRLADVLLNLGKFKEAFAEDEARVQTHSYSRRVLKRLKMPYWTGQDLKGKRILVVAEQALGDAIQAFREVQNLKDLGAEVILSVPTLLFRLFQYQKVADHFILGNETGEISAEADYVVTMGSLIARFGVDNLSTKPYLKADVGLSAEGVVGQECIKHAQGLKVGIVWSGNSQHPCDHIRSCFLKEFQPLAMSGVSLFAFHYSDQTRAWPDGVVNLMADHSVPMVDLCCKSGVDFLDTALLFKQMDLIISVDTSAAHLAGALGVPVWLLCHKSSDWRWQVKWYDSMVIYKMKESWPELMVKVAEDLSHLAGCLAS